MTGGRSLGQLGECKYATQYKGIYPPRCNKGNPCQVCRDKYERRQREAEKQAAEQVGKESPRATVSSESHQGRPTQDEIRRHKAKRK